MKFPWQKIPKRELDPDRERELREEMEKGDVPAMLLAAFLTIFLPVAGILLVLGVGVYFLFTLL